MPKNNIFLTTKEQHYQHNLISLVVNLAITVELESDSNKNVYKVFILRILHSPRNYRNQPNP